jgi:hypothetical protein
MIQLILVCQNGPGPLLANNALNLTISGGTIYEAH